MITIYKNKNDIPQNMEYIEINDIFFNQNVSSKLDKRAEEIIKKIDNAELLGKYKIKSKFNDVALDIDCLSTGCKTVLNVLYCPDKVFNLKECGSNALKILYHLKQGAVYSDYPIIPFDIDSVNAISISGTKIINDYEELKEWWTNEE